MELNNDFFMNTGMFIDFGLDDMSYGLFDGLNEESIILSNHDELEAVKQIMVDKMEEDDGEKEDFVEKKEEEYNDDFNDIYKLEVFNEKPMIDDEKEKENKEESEEEKKNVKKI